MKKKILYAGLVACCMFIIAGCSGTKENEEIAESTVESISLENDIVESTEESESLPITETIGTESAENELVTSEEKAESFVINLEKESRDQKGILLAFDDYSVDSWRENLDLFDKYGVKVTFFINATEPTDFCDEAISRGHEIGYHTAGHANLTEVSEKEFYEQAIAPIEVFREKGYELTSFAYPYGAYEEWMNEELLKYYDTVRGAFSFEGRYKESLHKGFIESFSLDNIHYESDEVFRIKVMELLDALANCDDGTIASVYSHAIGDGDWCITSERLKILFQEAYKRNLAFYTFNELQ